MSLMKFHKSEFCGKKRNFVLVRCNCSPKDIYIILSCLCFEICIMLYFFFIYDREFLKKMNKEEDSEDEDQLDQELKQVF